MPRLSLMPVLVALAVACAACHEPGRDTPGRRPVLTPKRLSFALVEDYANGHALWRVAEDFAVMRDLEIFAWRGLLHPHDFEEGEGAYDFEWLGRFARQAARQQIALTPMVVDLSGHPAFVAELGTAMAPYANVLAIAPERGGAHHSFASPPASLAGEEEAQSQWWARTIATLAADPDIETIGIVGLVDTPDRSTPGLLRPDRSRKPSFYTVDMLTDLLETGTISVADAALAIDQGRAPSPPPVRHHLFVRPDGRQVAILWADTPAIVDVQFVRGTSDVSEYLLDGWKGFADITADGVMTGVELESGVPRVFLAAP